MCRLLGISKQAFYKHTYDSAVRKACKEEFALEFVHRIRAKAPGIGGRKLWHMYRREFPTKERVGRDWFEDIICRYGLKVRKKKRKPRTTDSTHGLPMYPNLVYSFVPETINQMWVSDITYIPVWLSDNKYTFCYLSMVMDGYSREILGWSVGPTLEAQYSAAALEMALERLNGATQDTVRELIHHSDRGVQYASVEYVTKLKDRHIRISMTENGDPRENAMAERINLTMKDELLKGFRFSSVSEVREAVARGIEFYNTLRPHMSLDMMTPIEAAMCKGRIEKKWRSYRDEAIKRGTA